MPIPPDVNERDVPDTTTLVAGDHIRVLKSIAGVLASRKMSYADFISFLNSSVSGGGGVPPAGRLTLQIGDPTPTADLTAKTTVYHTGFRGNTYQIYNGIKLVPWTLTGTRSLALDATNYLANNLYDVYLFEDPGNPGTVLIGTGIAWGSATSRVGGLSIAWSASGILVNSGAATLRNGSNTYVVASGRASYLGTFRCSANGQTEDSKTKRFLWNYFNRVQRYLKYETTDASWSYATATIRQRNADAASQVEFVIGQVEDNITALLLGDCVTSSAGSLLMGIGFDSTTAFAAEASVGFSSGIASSFSHLTSRYEGLPSLGYNRLTWLERGNTGGTFYGVGAGLNKSFLSATILA